MTVHEKINAITELFDLPGDAVNIAIRVDHERGRVRVGYDVLMDEDCDFSPPLNLTMVTADPRDRAGNSNGKGVAP